MTVIFHLRKPRAVGFKFFPARLGSLIFAFPPEVSWFYNLVGRRNVFFSFSLVNFQKYNNCEMVRGLFFFF